MDHSDPFLVFATRRPSRHRTISGAILALLLAAGAVAGSEPAPPAVPDAAQTAPYPTPGATAAVFPLAAFSANGTAFAQSIRLAELGWTKAQLDAFLEGVRASYNGKGFNFDDTARQLQVEMGRRIGELRAREKPPATEGFAQPGRMQQYMKEARKRYGLQFTDSGLGYSIQPGREGVRPRPGDTIVITCAATAADGATKLPQLSTDRIRVKLADLLPGFMEGLQMMTVDSQAVFVLPPALSFGESEWPQGVERGAPLVFFVTLHEVISAEAAP